MDLCFIRSDTTLQVQGIEYLAEQVYIDVQIQLQLSLSIDIAPVI